MFDNPEIMRQLANGRLQDRRLAAENRRLAGPARRRTRARMPLRSVNWFSGRRRSARAPGPAAA